MCCHLVTQVDEMRMPLCPSLCPRCCKHAPNGLLAVFDRSCSLTASFGEPGEAREDVA